ncbi:MAG: hypothetical protein H6R19_3335 [Proteobacteria bacterium]|jgi:hypothetical protein|nr:hypothetical protein [Pseudomonadota bacterium]
MASSMGWSSKLIVKAENPLRFSTICCSEDRGFLEHG